MEKRVKNWVSGGTLVLFLTVPGIVRANYAEDAGIGTVTVLANVLYIPAKLTYATLGGITGSFAYVLTGGNFNTAEKVWTPSLGGNYVLNPEHLRGQQPIYFSGETTP